MSASNLILVKYIYATKPVTHWMYQLSAFLMLWLGVMGFSPKASAQCPPNLNFTVVAVNRCEPTAFFNFIGQNVPPTAQVFWDLDNTGVFTSNPSNPLFVNKVFSTQGQKIVRMRIITQNNDTCTVQNTVNVFPQPAINMVVSPDDNFTTCDTVLVKSFSLNPTITGTIFWTINGNTTPGATANNIRFNQNGPIPINIQVTDNNGCSNTFTTTRTVQVGAKFDGNFSSPDTNACLAPGLTTTFTPNLNLYGNTFDSIRWDFPGSTTPVVVTTTVTSPVVTYNNTGIFNVRMRIFKNGCATEIGNKIGYMNLERRPTVTFKVLNPITNAQQDTLTICSGTPITLVNTTSPNVSTYPGTWAWTIPGLTGGTTTDSLRTITPLMPGDYNVRLVYNARCNAELFQNNVIRVLGPRANLVMGAINRDACSVPYTVNFDNNSTVPTTGTNTYTWTFFSPTNTVLGTSNLPNPSFTYTTLGNHNVRLEVSNSATGCTSTLNLANFVRLGSVAVPPNITGNVTASQPGGCLPPGIPITFTPSLTLPTGVTVDSVIWYLPGQNDSIIKSTTSGPVTVTYNTPGVFRVRYSVYSRGCERIVFNNAAFVTIINRPTVRFALPTSGITFSGDTALLCVDQPIRITNTTTGFATLPGGFVWSIPGSTVDSTGNNRVVVRFPTPGLYNVTLSYQGTCNVDTTRNAIIRVRGPRAEINSSVARQSCTFPFQVQFNALNSDTPTTGTNTYTWTFFNAAGTGQLPGSPVSTRTPNFTYTAFGDYNVRLRITNSNGCSSTDSQVAFVQIRQFALGINPTPPAPFCAGTPLNVSNAINTTTHQQGYNYIWRVLGAGGVIIQTVSSQFPNIVIDSPGVYSLRQIVINDLNCRDSITRTNYLTVNGFKARVNHSGTFGCINQATGVYSGSFSVAGLVGSPTSYAWSASPNGGVTITGGTTANPTVAFSQPGFYDVSVTISGSGCSRTANISQLMVGTNANFTLPSSPVCLGVPQTLVNTSTLGIGPATTYSWSTIPANAATFTPTNTASAPQFVPNTNAAFRVVLQVTNDNGCIDTVQKLVTPFVLTGNFSTVDTLINCSPRVVTFRANIPNMVRYTWTFTDTIGGIPIITTQTTTADSVLKLYTSNGRKSVRLIIENQFGCLDTIEKINYVRVVGPQPDFIINNNRGCEPLNVTFQDISTNLTTYIFSYGDGSSTPYNLGTTNAKTYRFPNTTNTAVDSFKFSINFFATDGFCVFTRNDSVVVFPSPRFRFTADDTVGCIPHTVNFRDSSIYAFNPGSQYTWDFGDLTTSVQQNTSKTYNAPGNYPIKLRIVTPRGCAADTTWRFRVRVNPQPTAAFSVDDTVICFGDPVTFTSNSTPATGTNGGSPIQTYRWDFGDAALANDTSRVNPATYTYQNIGQFGTNLVVGDQNGCLDTISINNLVRVRDTLPPINNDIRYVSVIGPTSIRIAWNPTTSTSFDRYRLSRDAGGGFTVLQTSSVIGDSAYTDVTASTLTQAYSFALDVLDICNKPSVPGSIHSSIYLQGSSSAPGQVQITWNPYTGWAGGVQEYRIYRANNLTAIPSFLTTVPGSATSFTDASLCAGDYCYVVEAIMAGGPYTSFSNRACVAAQSSASTTPIDLSNVTVDYNANNIIVNWGTTTNPASNFVIDRQQDNQPWVSNYQVITGGSANTFRDLNVDVMNSTYSYRIRYTDTCGNVNNNSNIGKSILLSAQVDRVLNKDIILNWTRYSDWGAAGVAQYDVYQRNNSTGTLSLIGSTTDTNYVDTSALRFGISFDGFCYLVIARKSGGTVADSSASNISCTLFPSTLFLPTAFTPGGRDNLNNIYRAVGMSIGSFNMKIFDRFGNLVFESNDPNEGWNGQMNNSGADCPQGMYQVVVRAKGADRKNFRQDATLMLVR